MVYRGKPSAGCINCRKAKKRCGLEKPACERCVKLGKECSGYRDTTSLQIQDETISVQRKAERQKNSNGTIRQNLAPPTETVFGILTPGSTSDSSSSSDGTVELDPLDEEPMFMNATTFGGSDMAMGTLLVRHLQPKPDDLAVNFFFSKFTSQTGHWQFMRGMFDEYMDPCLKLSIKACGMAALNNQQHVVMGQEYARMMYVEALGLLNSHLRDPRKSKSDASLIAVSMLGYYENLVCEGPESIQSWKQHIRGATQLLKMRGKAQLRTLVGRLLFRQIRAQVVVQVLWDDEVPPDFFWELQSELEAQDVHKEVAKPVDALTRICFDFATVRAKVCRGEISHQLAADEASDLERRYIQWQVDAMADKRWQYEEIEVPDSEHVWDGKVHSFASGHPMPTAWNMWRCMRIMLSRTQEWLCRRFQFSESEREEQMLYFRKLRRQMTDGICASVPVQLGHAYPAYSSECPLITAYGSIWPIFFAGTCCLERVGPDAASVIKGQTSGLSKTSSTAPAQAAWLLDRLDYISSTIGLRWASGVANELRGDFEAFASRVAGRGLPVDRFPSTKQNGFVQTINEVQPQTWWTDANGGPDLGPSYLHTDRKPSLIGNLLTDDILDKEMQEWLGLDVNTIQFGNPP